MTYLKMFHSYRLSQGNIATKKTMQILHFVNSFGGCQKIYSQNVGQLVAYMFYEGPLMIFDLLRTSP